jgi:hypothetical protein
MIQLELPHSQEHGLDRTDRRFHVSLLALAMLYVIIAALLSSVGAFWSPDSGARFAMIRNWTEHGSLIHWFYPYRNIDPTGQIHPLAYFLFHTKDGFVPQYEPLFPMICGVMYRIFGFYGLTIIPTLSGLGTVWLIYATARSLGLRSALAISWVAGLGTPILVYSVVFWDHVVMFLVTAAAMYLLLRAVQDQSERWAAGAGAVLGLGVFIHELMLAVYLAMLLASLPLVFRRDGRRLVLGLVAGFIPLALLWMGMNWAIYGSIGGPHLDANMGGNTSDHPFSLHTLLNPQGFADRAQEELTGILGTGLMIVNTHVDLLPLFALFGYGLVGYWLITSLLGMTSRIAPVFSVIALLLALAISVLAFYLIFHVHWALGLFLATPLLIPALAVLWVAVPHRNLQESPRSEVLAPESLFYAWMSRATWIFLFGSILNPMLPGVDWGSRYLLPILPVMVVLAASALERQYEAARPVDRRAVMACIVVIVGISVYSQVEGLTMIHKNMVYNRAVNQRVLALKTQAIVFSNIGLGPELTAISVPQPQFMVRTPEDGQLLLKAFRQSHVHNFTFVDNNDATALLPIVENSLPGHLMPISVSAQYFNINPATEDGANMVFVQYALQAVKPTAAQQHVKS